MPNELDVKIQDVCTLPLIQYYMKSLDLYGMFEEFIPSAEQAKTHPAEGLCALIANIIIAPKPLCHVELWLADYVDGLHATMDKAAAFNDDFLGRCADKLYNADRSTMMAQASLKAIKAHELQTSYFNNDTTTVTLSGIYHTSDSANDSGKLRLMRGYNKDGRPDCKQLIFGLTTTNDGHIPLQYRVYNGNTSDDKTHISVWKELRDFLDNEDFIYTADCKFATAENMTTVATYNGKFISLLPRSRKESVAFRTKMMSTDIPWQEAYRKQNSRNSKQVDIYSIYDGELSAEGFRIVWVLSSAKIKKDADRRASKIKDISTKLNELSKKLNRYYLKTQEQIMVAIATSIKNSSRFFNIELVQEVEEIKVKKGRGRCGANTEYSTEVATKYILQWTVNDEAIALDARSDGVFPLITNTSLAATDILLRYKKQSFLEKRHNALKSVLEVAPVYLKNESRIEAIMFLYFIALMVVSLIERRIRLSMHEEKIVTLPIAANEVKTKTPTWNNIKFLFRNINRVTVIDAGKVISSKLKGITAVHNLVLKLLRVPDNIYHSPFNQDWWKFWY